LCGDDRPDARFVEQPGCERAHVSEHLLLELVGLDSGGLDPAREAAQHKPGRDLVGAHRG
jgi:hypothetical protein